MATIRLQQVSKFFHQPTPLAGRDPVRANQPVMALDQVNLTIPDGQTVAIVAIYSGQPVSVHFPSDQLYWFDSTSGVRFG